jgi:hypothetical protein
MANVSIIPNAITLGFVIAVLISSAFVLFWKGESIQTKGPLINFVMIIAFLILIIFIAIPFIDINSKVAGTPDNRSAVRDSMNRTIGWTVGISVLLLVICTYMIRTSKITQERLTFGFVSASMFISLLTMSMFTLQRV